MLKERFRVYRIITFIGDIILLNLSFILVEYLLHNSLKIFQFSFYLKLSLSLTLGWTYIGLTLKLYNLNRIERFEQSFSRLFQTIVLHALLLAALNLIVKDFEISRNLFYDSYLLFSFADTLWRLGLLFILKYIRVSDTHFRSAIILGSGPVARQMSEILRTHRGYGYKVLGIFDDNGKPDSFEYVNVTGTLDDARRFCLTTKVEDIFCALPLSDADKITGMMAFADEHLMRFKIVPDFTALNNKPVNIDYYGFLPVISLTNEPLNNFFNQLLKRSFDIVFSGLFILLVLSWLIPLVAVLIKLESKGPVFYMQKRSGLNYMPFRIFKFRTMTVTETDEEFVQAQKNDPRITKVGRFLRKYNIDELPQFINVFVGNMSVVGPRPHAVKMNEEYRSITDKFMIRHFVKPGVTGLAQVRGYRGGTNSELMRRRVMADVFYIENWRFLLDIKIIILTVWNMIKGEMNAY